MAWVSRHEIEDADVLKDLEPFKVRLLETVDLLGGHAGPGSHRPVSSRMLICCKSRLPWDSESTSWLIRWDRWYALTTK